jgi:hypothetical protein
MNLFLYDLNKLVLEALPNLISEYNLSFKKHNYPILVNQFCELHFVRFDQSTLRFHFRKPSDSQEFQIHIYQDIIQTERKSHFDYDKSNTSEEAIINHFVRIGEIIKSDLTKPINGDFSWIKDYNIREKEFEKLLNFALDTPAGKPAYLLWKEGNSNWEKVAKELIKTPPNN